MTQRAQLFGRRLSLFVVCILFPAAALPGAASWPVQFVGQNAELVLDQVSERTLRIEVLPLDESGRARPATASTVLAPFPSVERLRTRVLVGEKRLRLGRLRVVIKPRPLTVTLLGEDGKRVQELSFDEAASTNAGVVFRTDAPVLGLGEGARQFDRRGAFYPMEPSWGAWDRAVLGSVVPSPFLIGTDGWALFAHRPEGAFDLREGRGRFVPSGERSGVARLELFLVSVREPADALTEYDRLSGRPVMPPKWALGYFQSHRTLAGPEEPLEIARSFRERGLPCDALIYLGTGYCTNGWNTGHGSLDFNPLAFDHPMENLRALHSLNFKVILHVNHAPKGLFGASMAPTGNRNPASGPAREASGSPEDFDSPLHIRNYWARHRASFALGVDGWWPDDGDELPLEARLTRHRCYYEGPLQERPSVRPWSLHRTGYAGAQRYGGWIWSGDIDSRWATLTAQVSVGLNHGLSLTPFWGTDTGGFYPTRELTGELYARWFEFSAFCPLFRAHGRTWHLRLPWGWNTGETGPIENAGSPDPSELHNPEIEPICRKYLELRYRLLPYNYSLIREACDRGLPLMRALWLHYPEDPTAVSLGNEYLWGRDLLIAPVTEKGLASRRLYLPAGTWHDWWTGEKLAGRRWIERPVDLATLPIYVRAGAIIPLDPPRQYTAQPVTEPTTLRVFPGANGAFTLYDDDGESLGYRDGSDTVWIRFRWNDGARRLTVEPDERMKRRRGAAREFAVEMAGSIAKPKRIKFEGRRIEVDL